MNAVMTNAKKLRIFLTGMIAGIALLLTNSLTLAANKKPQTVENKISAGKLKSEQKTKKKSKKKTSKKAKKVKKPRDAASGRATGKRQHGPIQ